MTAAAHGTSTHGQCTNGAAASGSSLHEPAAERKAGPHAGSTPTRERKFHPHGFRQDGILFINKETQ